MTNLEGILKSRDITLSTKFHLVKAMAFPVVMYGCESWTIKLNTKELMLLNCGVGEDSWDPLDCKEIQPVHPKGNQSWIFIGRTDAEAPILWPPSAKNWLIGKDPDAGKDWRQEKGSIEDKMVRWHHQHNGHEFEQAPRVGGDGQGSLVCCSPWGRRVGRDWVTELNWCFWYIFLWWVHLNENMRIMVRENRGINVVVQKKIM